MKREYWEERRRQWQRALTEIAEELDEDSPLHKMLGPVAWRRYHGEPTALELKDNVIFGAGFLEGVCNTALRIGRALNLEGTLKLDDLYDRMRREEKARR